MASHHTRKFADQRVLIVIINVKSYVYITWCKFDTLLYIENTAISIRGIAVILISVYTK